MAKVTEDTIEGASLIETSDELEVVRRFIVEEIESNPEDVLNQALLASGVPTKGASHPTIAGIKVDSRRATPLGLRQAEITVTYKKVNVEDQQPDETAPPQISVGTTVQTAETSFDRDGEQIKVQYNKKFVNPETTSEEFKMVEQTGSVEIQAPRTLVRFTRKEDKHPGTKSIQYVGKVNSVPFLNVAPRDMLCTSIEGNSSDGGETYLVIYEFMLAADFLKVKGEKQIDWNPVVIFIDPDTGRPAKDEPDNPLGEGNGLAFPLIYEEIDFNQLSLGGL